MEKLNYKRTIMIVMLIILLLVIITGISYYRSVEIVTNISLCFIIACTTGVVIEAINGAKQEDSKRIEDYSKELLEMKNKIIRFRKSIKNLSRSRYRKDFYQEAENIMTNINNLNEQIEYLYENEKKKSLIRKFLINQDMNLEQIISIMQEIRDDIVNELDKKSIIKKMYRYNHKLDKLLYSINREMGIK